jgi:hypothetical protein
MTASPKTEPLLKRAHAAFPSKKDLPMERLIVSPDADTQKAGKFTACMESTGETIVSGSRQPLVDGARELLGRGYDPTTLLTMRHQGSTCDSFKEAPIDEWAKWTYTESETSPLRKARWMPRPAVGEGQKSGVWPAVGPEGRPGDDSLPRWNATASRADARSGW